ncbi:hypothetical protein HYU10_02900 [Candidatus Woesearchaeota archaeon]|nr:hypothetical protein [Candidatus Woesearchaeota archaeon]MBI2130695.1 hypothetical protein [Candidatus Woesearchaeota archaeon]
MSCKIIDRKKGVLFTVTAIMLLLSVYLLANAFSERSSGLSEAIIGLSFGDRLRFVEDDIISGSYAQLLDIDFDNTERSASFTLRFDRFFISPLRDYPSYMKAYETLAENKYSSLSNINITLSGFNSSFIARPYNSTFILGKSNFTILTMPDSANYIQTITANIRLNGTFSCDGEACEDQEDADENACEQPGNDPQGNPVIDITWEDKNGMTCTRSRRLDPTEDNNKGNGKQFYVGLLDAGNAEIKYGSVDGTNGIFRLAADALSANATQLDIGYALMGGRLSIEGGILSIRTPSNVTKSARIILYGE